MQTTATPMNPTPTHRAADMIAAAAKIVRVTANSLGIELKLAADQVAAPARKVQFA
ncbi:hypothetical protein AB4Y45_35125 [Paraburkholderia sp. EG287A]|uniref:hypothetical protein n=1 Tax=Paraburkholderia sp. EG287A TaxID=3237012 RepID=UPI0034D1752A